MAFSNSEIQEILDIFFNTVAHRQYIGQRYVPIFGRKNENSIEWNNSAPYEPLTIVIHEGNSYTSRQFVPAGVDITNNTYWALTGNFNAQVELYRQEVAAMHEEIEEMYDFVNSEAEPYVDVLFSAFHNVAGAFVNVFRMPRSKVEFDGFAVGGNLPNLVGAYDYTNSTDYALANNDDVMLCNMGLQAPILNKGVIKAQSGSANASYWNIVAIKEDGTIAVLPDPNHTYSASTLLSLGYYITFGAYEEITRNGQVVTDFSQFEDKSNYNSAMEGHYPRMAFGWDDNYFYLVFSDGRQPFNIGLSHDAQVAIAQEYGIPNLINCDGGGSVQVYLANSGTPITTVAANAQTKPLFSGANRRYVPLLTKFKFVRESNNCDCDCDCANADDCTCND